MPAPPYAERGSCNPDYESTMKLLGGERTILPFSLETESASSLQARLTAGLRNGRGFDKSSGAGHVPDFDRNGKGVALENGG